MKERKRQPGPVESEIMVEEQLCGRAGSGRGVLTSEHHPSLSPRAVRSKYLWNVGMPPVIVTGQ